MFLCNISWNSEHILSTHYVLVNVLSIKKSVTRKVLIKQ